MSKLFAALSSCLNDIIILMVQHNHFQICIWPNFFMYFSKTLSSVYIVPFLCINKNIFNKTTDVRRSKISQFSGYSDDSINEMKIRD